MATCEFVSEPCANGCGEMIQRSALQAHMDAHCRFRQIQCHYCLQMIGAQDVPDHVARCTHRLVKCPNKCAPVTMAANYVRLKRAWEDDEEEKFYQDFITQRLLKLPLLMPVLIAI